MTEVAHVRDACAGRTRDRVSKGEGQEGKVEPT